MAILQYMHGLSLLPYIFTGLLTALPSLAELHERSPDLPTCGVGACRGQACSPAMAWLAVVSRGGLTG